MVINAKRLPHLVPPVMGADYPGAALRLTVPARERLERAGNQVTRTDTPDGPRYTIELVRPPSGLVLCLIGQGAEQHHGVRCDDEPEYPGEWRDWIVWHERGEWTPCPECGHALLWCEAGYVPGWRVCLAGHAVQLSSDGRSGERKPSHDSATVRATKPVGAV